MVAVGFESTAHGRPARYQLLFDPRSGALRGVEEAVTTLLVNPQTGRDYLNVRIRRWWRPRATWQAGMPATTARARDDGIGAKAKRVWVTASRHQAR